MTTIYVTDSEGEELEVEGQVGLPIMETLRDLDNGVMALCGGMCFVCHLPLLYRGTMGFFTAAEGGG